MGHRYYLHSRRRWIPVSVCGARSAQRGNCFDNACVESFFSHLKTEKLYLEKTRDLAHARKLIAEYI
ncbi:transposase [Brevibacillus sp. NSP2.1]|nr:transposase [Brevibacillus sp. NSP2.1]